MDHLIYVLLLLFLIGILITFWIIFNVLSNRIDKLEKSVKIHGEDLKEANKILIRFNEWFKKIFRDLKTHDKVLNKADIKREIQKKLEQNEHRT